MNNIAVNFEHLKFPEEAKEAFKEKVISVMREKYSDTNTRIFEDGPLASELGLREKVKFLNIHNQKGLDLAPEEALGVANPETGYAEVNINDFVDLQGTIGLDSLASQVGTIGSHEAYHLFGPLGHSVEATENLMSKGHISTDELVYGDGASLEFTDFQKSILRSGVDFQDIKLSCLESEYLLADDIQSDYETENDESEDILDKLDIDDLNDFLL